MSLQFYDDAQAFWAGGIMRKSFNATTGSVVEQLLHIRNDNNAVYYTNIVVSVNENTGLYGTSGFSIKMLSGSRQPTEAEWASGTSSLNLADIGAAGAGDNTTYLPFWVRMYCPAGFTLAQTRDDFSLTFAAVENPV